MMVVVKLIVNTDWIKFLKSILSSVEEAKLDKMESTKHVFCNTICPTLGTEIGHIIFPFLKKKYWCYDSFLVNIC